MSGNVELSPWATDEFKLPTRLGVVSFFRIEILSCDEMKVEDLTKKTKNNRLLYPQS